MTFNAFNTVYSSVQIKYKLMNTKSEYNMQFCIIIWYNIRVDIKCVLSLLGMKAKCYLNAKRNLGKGGH